MMYNSDDHQQVQEVKDLFQLNPVTNAVYKTHIIYTWIPSFIWEFNYCMTTGVNIYSL